MVKMTEKFHRKWVRVKYDEVAVTRLSVLCLYSLIALNPENVLVDGPPIPIPQGHITTTAALATQGQDH